MQSATASAVINIIINSSTAAAGVAGVTRQFALIETEAKAHAIRMNAIFATIGSGGPSSVSNAFAGLAVASPVAVQATKAGLSDMEKEVAASAKRVAANHAASTLAIAASVKTNTDFEIREAKRYATGFINEIGKGSTGAKAFGHVAESEFAKAKEGIKEAAREASNLASEFTGSKMSGAASRITSFANALTGLGSAGSAGVALGGIAAVTVAAAGLGTVLFELLHHAAETGESFHKMSLLTGLSAEAVSTLDFNAKLIGSSLDNLTLPMKTFTVLLADARGGSDKASESLRRLGVKDLTDVDKAFDQAVTHINANTDAIERTKEATLAFGSRGVRNMLPLLDKMSGGFLDAIKNAKAMGVVLSEDDVRAAEEFNKTLHTVEVQLGLAVDKFALTYGPMVTTELQILSDSLGRNQDEWKAWGKTVGIMINNAVLLTRDFVASVELVNNALLKMTGQGDGTSFADMWEKWNKASDQAEADYLKAVQRMNNPVGHIGAELGGRGRPGDVMEVPGAVPDVTSHSTKLDAAMKRALSDKTMADFQAALRKLPDPLKQQILASAAQYGIPEGIALAQIFSESTFKPGAVSPFNTNVGSSAYGLTQQLPATASRLLHRNVTGKELTSNTKTALSAWGIYMDKLFDEFGDWELAAFAYHNGEGAARKFQKILATGDTERINKYEQQHPAGISYMKEIGALGKVSGDARFQRGTLAPYAKALMMQRPSGIVEAGPNSGVNEMTPLARMTPDAEYLNSLREGLNIENNVELTVLKERNALAAISTILESQAVNRRDALAQNKIDLGVAKGRLAAEEAIEKFEQSKTDQINEQKNIQRDMLLLQKQNADSDFVQQRRANQAAAERFDLEKQMSDLHDQEAMAEVNQALFVRLSTEKEIFKIHQEDLSAQQDAAAALVRINDSQTIHYDKANAAVLQHIASVKSMTDIYADAKIGIVDKVYGGIDQLTSKLTAKLPFIGSILGSILADVLKLAVNKIFMKLLFPESSPVATAASGGGGILGQILGGLGGIFGGGAPSGTPPFIGGLGSSGSSGSQVSASQIQHLLGLDTSGGNRFGIPLGAGITPPSGSPGGGGLGGLLSAQGIGSAVSTLGVSAVIGLFIASLHASSPLKGLAMGGLVGLIAGYINRTKLRRQEEVERTTILTDSKKQMQAIIDALRGGNLDSTSALAQAQTIRDSYIQQVSALKDKKTRNIALATVRELDQMIEQIKTEGARADYAKAQQNAFVPTFAQGGSVDYVSQLSATSRANSDDNVVGLFNKRETVITPMNYFALGGNIAMKRAGVRGAGMANGPASSSNANSAYNAYSPNMSGGGNAQPNIQVIAFADEDTADAWVNNSRSKTVATKVKVAIRYGQDNKLLNVIEKGLAGDF